MKTDKQISNSHNRAAKLAFDAAQHSQIAHFAASSEQMSQERGHAMNAAGFAAQALSNLENGNYESFLTCLSLAGDFTKDARNTFYARSR